MQGKDTILLIILFRGIYAKFELFIATKKIFFSHFHQIILGYFCTYGNLMEKFLLSLYSQSKSIRIIILIV